MKLQMKRFQIPGGASLLYTKPASLNVHQAYQPKYKPSAPVLKYIWQCKPLICIGVAALQASAIAIGLPCTPGGWLTRGEGTALVFPGPLHAFPFHSIAP